MPSAHPPVSYVSKLDAAWPPTPPPEEPAVARFMSYLIRQQADRFFGFLRFFWPNFGPGDKLPVFVTRFRDVQEVLDRPEVFNVAYGPMMEPTLGEFMLDRDGTIFNQRDKGIMRALIQREDLPRIREMTARHTDAQIDAGVDGGTLDVVAHLARHVPILVIGEYFGFPGPDMESMLRWSRATQHDMFHNQELSGPVHDANIEAGREMRAYVRDELLPARRAELERNPELDDVVSRMLKTRFPPEIGFDEERMVTNIMGLLIGGCETTQAAVTQSLDQLLRRPAELDGAIRAARASETAAAEGDTAARDEQDRLLFQYCWEALRFNPVNPLVARKCAQDYRVASGTWRSKRIKKGRVVLVCTRSAMKDGRELPRPRQFRIDRPMHHYMHLGYGLHTCLGNQVAWALVPGIIKQLLLRPGLRRLGDIDYEGGPFPEHYHVQIEA